jgi:protein O-GlcNAc transferase
VSSHQLLGQAMAFHRAGQLVDAELLYQQILAAEPVNTTVRHLLGLIRYHQGRNLEALELIGSAVTSNPRDPEAQSNYGNVLKTLGRFEAALASYDNALAIRPHYPEVLNNRGIVLADMRRFSEALDSYDRALAANPGYAEALFNRGLALWFVGRMADALESYDKAVLIRPDYAQAWNNRGNVLRALNRPKEARASYERALALDPNNAYALGGVAFSVLNLCDWPKAAELGCKIETRIAEDDAIISPFILLGYSDEPALHLQCARSYSRDRLTVRPPPLWQGTAYRHDRIRLAYLSSDFRNHPMAYLTAGLFEQHDRSRFEVMGISIGPDDHSDIRARLAEAFDRFEDGWLQSDHDLARRIRALEADIVIDLNGYTEGGRPEILSCRPAPVQAGYLGFPATTGADFLDYIIADQIVLPFDRQPFFTETIVHLPDCYFCNDSRRTAAEETPSRPDEGLPAQGFVFCSFNNCWKITEAVFDVWMRLLAAVPGSVLWLIKSNDEAVARLKSEASARGIAPQRLVFGERVRPQAHLARHRLADLMLDTLPYNAHTTACDGLWMGVPLITLRGRSFTGRVAASMLAAIGLPELVAENIEEYEVLALKLATDAQFLRSVQRRLEQNRLSYPLFDTGRFCRNIEAAYIQMWTTNARGERPSSFTIAPDTKG